MVSDKIQNDNPCNATEDSKGGRLNLTNLSLFNEGGRLKNQEHFIIYFLISTGVKTVVYQHGEKLAQNLHSVSGLRW